MNHDEKLAQRLQRWAIVNANKKIDGVPAQQIEWLMCDRDITYWFDNYCWTFDPRKNPGKRLFELYPFQRWFVQEAYENIANGKDFLIEKSRDMGLSWLIILVMQYCWLFKGWDFHVGSRKESEVDEANRDPSTLFGKFRYNLYNLPWWMCPEGVDASDKKLSIINPLNNASFTGESANPSFGRSKRKKAVFFDEMNFWDVADKAYGAASETAPCRIVTSTPEGDTTPYAKLANDPANIIRRYPEAERIIKEKKIEKVVDFIPPRALCDPKFYGNGTKAKQLIYTLWWPIHPEKGIAEYENAKTRLSEDKLASEWDINYSLSVTGKVFGQYRQHRHVTHDWTFTRKRPVYRIWDFGYVVNCTLYIQVDDYNRKRILLSRVLEQCSVDDQIEVAKIDAQEIFPRAEFIDICDPAGSFKDGKANSTFVDTLYENGIDASYDRILRLPHRTRKENGIEKIRLDLQKTPGGEEGFQLFISEDGEDDCSILKQAFEGGYAYKKDYNGNILDKKIDEKHPYEDVMDCLIYYYIQTDNMLPSYLDNLKVSDAGGYESPYLGY